MTQIGTHRLLRRMGCGLLLTSAIALTGCSGFEQGHPGTPLTADHNVGAAGSALPNSSTGFAGDLAENYYAMATIRQKNGDSVDADYWARKSLAASKGDVVPPEEPKIVAELTPVPLPEGAKQESLHTTNWNIPGLADPGRSPNVQALHDARVSLVSALDNGGRDRFPSLAARTQAYYDCWIERSEANVPEDAARRACYAGFVRDYTDLSVLLKPPQTVNTYFAHDSATLTPQGKDQVAKLINDIRYGTATLNIVGKTDRSGTNGYNMKLSEARAAAVRQQAIADGLPADRIKVSWTGENQLPIQTTDGVKESRNRVVEVDTAMPSAEVAALPPRT